MVTAIGTGQVYQQATFPSYPPKAEETGTSSSTARKVGYAVSIQHADTMVIMGTESFVEIMELRDEKAEEAHLTTHHREQAINAYETTSALSGDLPSV